MVRGVLVEWSYIIKSETKLQIYGCSRISVNKHLKPYEFTYKQYYTKQIYILIEDYFYFNCWQHIEYVLIPPKRGVTIL